jgi:hypothetical protein
VRRDGRYNGQATAMGIEQAIDEMKIAEPAAARAGGR